MFGASVICIACGTHSGKDEDASSRSQKSGGFKFSAPAIVADDEGDDVEDTFTSDNGMPDLDTLLAGVASHSNRGLAAHLGGGQKTYLIGQSLTVAVKKEQAASAKLVVLRCFFCKKTPQDVLVGRSNHHHQQ